jgi:hypothetical protein
MTNSECHTEPRLVTRLTKRRRLCAHEGHDTALDKGDAAKISSSEADAARLRRQCAEGTALYRRALIEAGAIL